MAGGFWIKPTSLNCTIDFHATRSTGENSMEILAKSDPPQSLEAHLQDVENQILKLLTPARLNAFKNIGIESEVAEKLCVTVARFHDIGKATKEWQANVTTGNRLPQHSLTSFWAVLWVLGITNIEHVEQIDWTDAAIALAILAHHGQLHRGSFQTENHNSTITPVQDEWVRLTAKLGMQNLPGLVNNANSRILCTFIAKFKGKVVEWTKHYQFRALYCLLLTLLIDADHQASALQNGNTEINKLGILHSPNMKWAASEFQNHVANADGSQLCAIAACGAGKTAAALMYAAKLYQNQKIDRVIFCLPTRFTSNAIMRDLTNPKKYGYNRRDVALIHGEALAVLQNEIGKRNDDEELTDTREEDELRRYGLRFEHAITISTIDHMLMSLYHGYKFSDRAFGNMLSSLVVVDEVHAYDTTILNALKDGLRILEEHNIPTLIMSATLPQSRQNFLFSQNTIPIEENTNSFRPFIIKKLSTPLTCGKGIHTEAEHEMKEILKDLKVNRVAIYVNQIERAKAIALAVREILPACPVLCYHSELAGLDRAKLEIEIVNAFHEEKPVILVATQAAELSLDISAEMMITELAPADTLVQRAGRLNRRATTPVLKNGEMATLWLAPTQQSEDTAEGDCLPYTDMDVLNSTWENTPWEQIFSMKVSKDWCEKSLRNEIPVKSSNLQNQFNEDTVFGYRPQDNFTNDDISQKVVIRDISEITFTIIPETLLEEFNQLEKKERTPQKLASYLVPLRRGKYGYLKTTGLLDKQLVELYSYSRKNNEKVFQLPIYVLWNVIYDPHIVGINFKELETLGELSPTTTYADFY